MLAKRPMRLRKFLSGSQKDNQLISDCMKRRVPEICAIRETLWTCRVLAPPLFWRTTPFPQGPKTTVTTADMPEKRPGQIRWHRRHAHRKPEKWKLHKTFCTSTVSNSNIEKLWPLMRNTTLQEVNATIIERTDNNLRASQRVIYGP